MFMSLHMRSLLSLAIVGGLSTGAFAAAQVIHQQGRAFSSEIMSASKGNEFNLGSQPPGSSTDVTFKETGDVAVICAIHPRMKMTVKVVD
jgi:hypothetical protein